MSRKPLIGLIPQVDYEHNRHWMRPAYMEGVAAAGGLPVMLPLTADPAALAQMAGELDAILFTGGPDLHPRRYGEELLPICGELSLERDDMELALLDLVLAGNKPALGICRGIQTLNAALGGTLYQDLPAQRPSAVVHYQEKPYSAPIHPVELVPGAPLAELTGEGTLQVNSMHHQGIKDLAPALRPMAHAPDGLTEAVWMPEKPFVWAVQWHPEYLWPADEPSRRLFGAFVRAAAGEDRA